MSFIVCRNCKKFVKVDVNVPLNFDKCQNCGNTLEFAGDSNDLNYIINDIEIPKVSSNKICASCHSINPRETGTCLFCGSSSFLLQYDADSVNKYNKSVSDIQERGNAIIIQTSNNVTRIPFFVKVISIVMGLVDFFFFAFVGLQLTIDLSAISSLNPADVIAYITPHANNITLVIVASLLLSGILATFIIPKISYKQAFKLTSVIGIIIGLSTLYLNMGIGVLIASIIFCGLFTGLGGLIGEAVVHFLLSKLNS